MATKNYSSIYDIKNFAYTELIPRFFDENVSTSNLGLLGYTTELISSMFEDSFTTMSFLYPEMYPNKAQLPETLYTYAALFKYSDVFATPAYGSFVLFVLEDDILNKGTVNDDGSISFFLDRDLVLTVKDLEYMLDYNIRITAKEYRGEWIFQAKYDKVFDGKTFNNSISDINTPYLKSKRVIINSSKYLMIAVEMHQVTKEILEESLIDNDVLNVPTISFEFEGELCGFNVFYRETPNVAYEQLEKVMFSGLPVAQDFCYFKPVNSNKIEISFTTKDGYFQPAFNSELYIEYYTTRAEEGNFKEYTGTEISVATSSQTYDYNNGLVVMGTMQSESKGGLAKPTLTQLKNIVCQLFTTVDSISTENDLRVYFNNFANTYNNEMKFIKLRDDYLKRVYSAFVLLKNSAGEIYDTNTITLSFTKDDFDKEYEQTKRWIVEPGRIFKYRNSGSVTGVPIGKERVLDVDLDTIDETSVFCLPFLTSITKKPQSVAFYVNTVNDIIKLDYKYANEDSFVQFICNSLTITRDSMAGEDRYHLKCVAIPTTDKVDEIATKDKDTEELIDNGILKLKVFVKNSHGSRLGYIDLSLTDNDDSVGSFTFEGDLQTDDYITDDNEVRLTNLISIESGEVLDSSIVPMVDTVMELAIFYKSEQPLSHQFNTITDVVDFTLTNLYEMDESRATLIQPIDIISSTMSYEQVGSDRFLVNLELVPVFSARTFQENDYFELMANMVSQYNYMGLAKKKLTNNFSINLKFYNTYGRAKNFYAGEEQTLLDTVNCKIAYRVKLIPGANVEESISDIKIFIKDYIESINSDTVNALYVSNLTTALEQKFSDILYMKFVGINDFTSDIQSLTDFTSDSLDVLSSSERILYVPEYLTIKLDDINIMLIE